MDWLRTLLRRYRTTLQSDRRHLLEEFRLAHAARKVVGVGSVGTRAWIVLMFGRDDADPLFLQAKEAQPSVLEEFVGPSRHVSNGERVVHGQHLMAAASDIFLGWITLEGLDGVSRDFYLRQLRDWKGSAVVETMDPRPWRTTARSAARPWPAPTPAPATASRSPPTSVGATPSTRPSPSSPRPTPTRTNATTTPSSQAEKDGRITAQRGSLTWRTEDLWPCAVCGADGPLGEH